MNILTSIELLRISKDKYQFLAFSELFNTQDEINASFEIHLRLILKDSQFQVA